jgi:hypothetical protein
MSKFLKLVQENTPGEEAGRGPYTVEYKDSQGNVMARLTLPNDVGSSYDNFLGFAKNMEGDLEVASKQPEVASDHPVEDESEAQDLASATKSIMAIPDQSMGSRLISQTARKGQRLKKRFLDKLTAMVDAI